MKKMYELITVDENGCTWNWEDEECNIIIKAETAEEAEHKFMDTVDYEYEDEARKYIAKEIEDIATYKQMNRWIEW